MHVIANSHFFLELNWFGGLAEGLQGVLFKMCFMEAGTRDCILVGELLVKSAGTNCASMDGQMACHLPKNVKSGCHQRCIFSPNALWVLPRTAEQIEVPEDSRWFGHALDCAHIYFSIATTWQKKTPVCTVLVRIPILQLSKIQPQHTDKIG